MKIGHHIWNKEHHIGPILTTKGKSGPNLTTSLNDYIGKRETKGEAGTGGGGWMGLKHHRNGANWPWQGANTYEKKRKGKKHKELGHIKVHPHPLHPPKTIVHKFKPRTWNLQALPQPLKARLTYLFVHIHCVHKSFHHSLFYPCLIFVDIKKCWSRATLDL